MLGSRYLPAASLAMLTACTSPRSTVQPRVATPAATAEPSPIIIAHRGASGYRPEHTLQAYELAIVQGADYIEPDLVATKDGILVARHENEIGETTDAATRFPDRRSTKTIDGRSVSGWFSEDFTLAELRTLRARERLPFRSREFDGRFTVPTLDEVLELVKRQEREIGRRVGVYPELKHPGHFRRIGLPLEARVLETLRKHGYTRRDDPVFLQSFELESLRRLRESTVLRLVMLIDANGRLPDDTTRAYADLVTPSGLAALRRIADGVGLNKRLVVPVDRDGRLQPPTDVVRRAHAAGFLVHVWTLRSDSVFLSPDYRGDPQAEWRQFASLGVDGVFGDQPDVGVAALRSVRRER
jgi:glycerophosphoryl diester phosphodiesterase